MPTIGPRSTISCPQCQQPILAHVDQILDVGQDPEAKSRLFSGQFNLANCPSCGFAGMIGTPIVYHDPDNQLLLTYVPVELNMPMDEKERVLGSLTRAIISKIPSENRTGYLLQPQEILSLQGLIKRVLEADGVTPEVIEAQRAKLELIDKLDAAGEESLPDLVKQHDNELDYAFFQLITARAAQAAEADDKPSEDKYLGLREQVLKHSTFGHEAQQQMVQLQAATKELESLGKNLNRETLLDMIKDSQDDGHITALVTLARPLLDYEFFLQLTRQIEQQEDTEREKLEHVREVALKAVNQADAIAKERSESATNLLQALLQSDDLQALIKSNLSQFDELFMAVLMQTQEAAKKTGEEQTVGKLEQIRNAVVEALHNSAPPEIRLINEMLSLESDEDAIAFIRNRVAELNPDVLKAMESVSKELKASERGELAERLDYYLTMAEKEITLAKWR